MCARLSRSLLVIFLFLFVFLFIFVFLFNILGSIILLDLCLFGVR